MFSSKNAVYRPVKWNAMCANAHCSSLDQLGTLAIDEVLSVEKELAKIISVSSDSTNANKQWLRIIVSQALILI